MKLPILISLAVILGGCATRDYQLYAEQTAKIIQANSAAESACFLVIAEGLKAGDNSTKTAITTQLDKCKKESIKIEPPKKNWLGF
jgi:hypothetical protein